MLTIDYMPDKQGFYTHLYTFPQMYSVPQYTLGSALEFERKYCSSEQCLAAQYEFVKMDPPDGLAEWTAGFIVYNCVKWLQCSYSSCMRRLWQRSHMKPTSLGYLSFLLKVSYAGEVS